jgi:hypothetical protein
LETQAVTNASTGWEVLVARANKYFRIKRLAVDPHLVMQVRAGRAPRRTKLSDHCALLDLVAFSDRRL